MRTPALPRLLAALVLCAMLGGCAAQRSDDSLRLGYFPNVTHAQALYGIQNGLFEASLGDGNFTKASFNAGPAAIEALLTRQVDATYVGPGPVLNAWARSGDTVRIIAGAASGGARFIVQPGLDLTRDADLGGKTFASPQRGNTQDISLKAYLQSRGHATDDRGGDVRVINAGNPDILTLFVQGEVDGAWVPEPWATRLLTDGHGRELLDERSLWPGGQFATTLLVTTKQYLAEHPDRIRALLAAHVQATQEVQPGGPAVLAAINDGIAAATGKRLGTELLATAFTGLNFTYDPLVSSIASFGEKAKALGLVAGGPASLSEVVTLAPLDEVLARQGLAGVPR
ncbi:MAG TPA: ABC transporter substrate-binding protein [Candidatus Thermoplasmatota archaeon]|nr:ABC transporter substrate-binding protein [Candidatus Thermoplasmatota archaeon]